MALAPCWDPDCKFCSGEPQNPGSIIFDGGHPDCPNIGKFAIKLEKTPCDCRHKFDICYCDGTCTEEETDSGRS